MQMVYGRGTAGYIHNNEAESSRRAPPVDENDDDPVDKIGYDDEFIQFDMPKSTG
jgi:hypothetical protein